MKKNTIYWIIGGIAAFYILKKKGIIGESIMSEAESLTANQVNKLNFKIDYSTFRTMYQEQQDKQVNGTKCSSI